MCCPFGFGEILMYVNVIHDTITSMQTGITQNIEQAQPSVESSSENVNAREFQVNESSCVPIWLQIRRRMVYLITSGRYERGERIPSVRELSVQLGVNYNTVNKVYRDLERDKLIFTKRGLGTYVSDLRNVDLSEVDSEVESLAFDFVQQAIGCGLSSDDIHSMVERQLILAEGSKS